MKKILLLIAVPFLLTSCNRNPENVTVVYDTIPTNDTTDFHIIEESSQFFSGVLPCADCKGILTEITLNSDSLTYHIQQTYQGKDTGDTILTGTGSYVRNLSAGDASIIYQLNASRPDDVRYFKAKGDSALIMLDKQQKEIKSSLNYRLVKR